ncbi:macro domain-containing protein [Sulfurospirillum multivorans]|uniref:Thoeris protein ThsA Macro domain-containing protein n=2 Tax=Sulfurospirillum multivorans TaxID=66821 RepID=A0AA86AQ87_SULMK|nr:macro domain-containing protein [Sulfurospirillum multivorans]AHJ13792.1 hypothetical protein SMUL_2550 [Sulfurospirillum multivorans DSM 12446]QEH07282.1 hypothetical protein SMN_2526 [Sulfurospirillum multivorans]
MSLKKVGFFDKAIRDKFSKVIAWMSSIVTLVFVFSPALPSNWKLDFGMGFIAILFVIYIYLWVKANLLSSVKINIEGSEVNIKAGDIFAQDGLKVIAFNEYFDTKVDDNIISSKSLNGIFINKYFKDSAGVLDQHIENYDFEENKIEVNSTRNDGKKQKFKIGTICLYKFQNNEEFILTAFTKFDIQNKATLTMPEYLEFLIKFWDEINRVYAQKSVSVPIFGSGITRIKEHKNISDEELLKIMLWTFRISEMRFKYPAKLTIVVHKDKINQINLLDIEMAKNGL